MVALTPPPLNNLSHPIIFGEKKYGFKTFNLRSIRTGSQLYWIIMYSNVLYTIFHEYQNKKQKINTSYF